MNSFVVFTMTIFSVTGTNAVHTYGRWFTIHNKILRASCPILVMPFIVNAVSDANPEVELAIENVVRVKLSLKSVKVETAV